MSCAPATFRQDGVTSARTTRERSNRSQQQLIRPRTVAGGERERSVNRAIPVKNTWLQRAKVYENSFIEMKNRNAAKKQNSQSYKPQAYDIEEHLESAQGVVVIGKNGVRSNDQYYVKCMKRSKSVPSTGSDVDSSFLSSDDENSLDNANNEKIPLCWKQQLQDKDVVRICEPTTNISSITITKSKNQPVQGTLVVKDTVKQMEETKKRSDHKPFMYVMLSWGVTCVLEWKDCLPTHLHPKPNDALKEANGDDDTKAHLPTLAVLLDQMKEHDHSSEWRHINSTLCIWLSWSHANKDNTYEVYVTDRSPVCTRAFTGVKARIVYDNIYIMHFNLVNTLPWISSLSEIQGKQFNITISRYNPLLKSELKLLCEDVQLGTSFEDNWCNPRTLSGHTSQINIEEVDEDKTDLLAISDLLPDLLKFSPNSSLDTSREQSHLISEREGCSQSTNKQPNPSDNNTKSILITQKSLLWQQNSTTSAVHTGNNGNALLRDKGHLLNTELALSRTIRNYNNKRHHSTVKAQNGKRFNALVRANGPVSYRAKRPQWQDSKAIGRPQSSVAHKKSSTHKTAKVRPFSAVPVANTNTAKDLELLAKSITDILV